MGNPRDHLSIASIQQLVATKTAGTEELLHLGHCRQCAAAVASRDGGWSALRTVFPSITKLSDLPPWDDSLVGQLESIGDRIHKALELEVRADILLGRTPAEHARLCFLNVSSWTGLGTVQAVLKKCSASFHSDPQSAKVLAETALELLGRVDPIEEVPGVVQSAEARAWAYLMNAQRVMGRYREADQLAQRGLASLEEWTADPETKAEVMNLLVSLRRDQGRFSEAQRLARESADLYQAVGNRRLEITMKMQEGVILRRAGRPREAVHRLGPLLDELKQDSGSLGFAVRFNYALAAAESPEQLQSAIGLLSDLERDARQLPYACATARVTFLKAIVAQALGQSAKAYSLYLEYQEFFLDRDRPDEAAFGGLEIAKILLQYGCPEHAAALAGAVQRIFSASDIEQKGLQAAGVFLEALKKQEATIEMARQALKAVGTFPCRRLADDLPC